MIPTSRKTLRKSERLSKKKDIEALFNQGRALFFYPYKFIYLEIPEGDDDGIPLKMMVTVARRNFRRAVLRNLLKRRIREIYRHQKHHLLENMENKNRYLHLGIIYVAPEIMSYRDMEKKFAMATQKLLEQLKFRDT
ncbi:MAG: ribonuclease P protein component [Bacteroidota bacterium]